MRGETDANGRTPGVGDFVAYNCSGNIATGWITSTGRYKNRYRKTFQITQQAPTEGKKSVVRGGASCLLVLEKGDGVVKGFYEPETLFKNKSPIEIIPGKMPDPIIDREDDEHEDR